MASLTSTIFTVTLLCLLFTFSIQTHSLSPSPSPSPPPSAPVPATSVCRNTQFPGYCRSILISDNGTSNVYEYGRFSFKKSISQSNNFLKLINKYLTHTNKLHLTSSAVHALQDCQFLAQLNLDFLTASFQAVGSTSKSLPLMKSEDVQTLLSGVLTNQQTCLDGLQSAAQSWSAKNGLVSPLANDAKLFSISLALFTKAWAPRRPKPSRRPGGGRKHSAFGHGRLPGLNMSAQARSVFESTGLRHRRLLQAGGDGDGDGDDDQVIISEMVTVSQDGTGNFTLINDAVAAAPNKTNADDGYFLIYVTAGVYEEYVNIDKKKRYIMMIGDGINRTIITGNRSVAANYTTFNSATFAVSGTGFVAVNITIRNTAGAINHQAVALRSGADLSTFYSCSFEGYQDTLYVHSMRQFYRECDIYGTVDFIFGNAAAVFQNCNLYPRLPLDKQFNAITAQGRTDPNQNTGISIINCTIMASDELANINGSTLTFLGRPWKPYSRTVYMDSFIGDVVDPAGWREWNETLGLDTLYYGEYNNVGPGSNTANRVTWPGYHIMNSTDASYFTVSTFVYGDDWLPQTGIPYASGLV